MKKYYLILVLKPKSQVKKIILVTLKFFKSAEDRERVVDLIKTIKKIK